MITRHFVETNGQRRAIDSHRVGRGQREFCVQRSGRPVGEPAHAVTERRQNPSSTERMDAGQAYLVPWQWVDRPARSGHRRSSSEWVTRAGADEHLSLPRGDAGIGAPTQRRRAAEECTDQIVVFSAGCVRGQLPPIYKPWEPIEVVTHSRRTEYPKTASANRDQNRRPGPTPNRVRRSRNLSTSGGLTR